MLGFLGIVVVALLIGASIWWIIRHLKGFVKVLLILVLCLLALGLITDPGGAVALGWFLFVAVLLIIAGIWILFLKGKM